MFEGRQSVSSARLHFPSAIGWAANMLTVLWIAFQVRNVLSLRAYMHGLLTGNPAHNLLHADAASRNTLKHELRQRGVRGVPRVECVLLRFLGAKDLRGTSQVRWDLSGQAGNWAESSDLGRTGVWETSCKRSTCIVRAKTGEVRGKLTVTINPRIRSSRG